MTDTDSTSVPRLDGYDPTDPAEFADPFPTWERARREAPVFFHDALGYWQVTRREDVLAVVRDTETFSSAGFYGMMKVYEENRDLIPDGLAIEGAPSLANADPPLHTRVRRVCDPAFRRSKVNALEEFITQSADGLIDTFVDSGKVDLVERFSRPLPLLVMARILGLPTDEGTLAEIERYSDEVPEAVSPLNDQARQREIFQHYGGFYRFCRDAIESARRNPSDSLLSSIVAEADSDMDGSLTEHTVVSAVGQMIFAGHETTRSMITQTMLNLLRHQDQLDRVRRDPALAQAAVEESLRYRGAIAGLMRMTTREVELAGTTIPAGAIVQACFASANRDDSEFADPDRFDIDRHNAQRHIAFGHGAHTCLGAPLARLELEIAIQRLLARLPGVRLTREPHLPEDYLSSPNLLGIRRLDIEWN